MAGENELRNSLGEVAPASLSSGRASQSLIDVFSLPEHIRKELPCISRVHTRLQWIPLSSIGFAMAGAIFHHYAYEILVAFAIDFVMFVISWWRFNRGERIGWPKLYDSIILIVHLGQGVVCLSNLISEHVTRRYEGPIVTGTLFLAAILSLLVGQPFALTYLRDYFPPWFLADKAIFYLLSLYTWVWVVAFALMFASTCVYPFFAPGNRAVDIVCSMTLPYVIAGILWCFSTQVWRACVRCAPHEIVDQYDSVWEKLEDEVKQLTHVGTEMNSQTYA